MARPRGIAYPALILGPLALGALFALREVTRDTGPSHSLIPSINPSRRLNHRNWTQVFVGS
jgi:hypothetical protein